MYHTEDLDVRSKMDNVARTIQMLPTVGQLSQLHNRRITSPPATGFQVTLQCYTESVRYGGCSKKQEQVLITQSHTTLCACLEELHSQIQERHSGDCVKAVQAFNSAQLQDTSTAAEGLLVHHM